VSIGREAQLGVPCVVDRPIQQAMLQVLQKRWDPMFSEHSCGFRPGRSAHQAVPQAQATLPCDIPMARIAARIADKRVFKLIRAFLWTAWSVRRMKARR
jgi:RNA-directed DNA polymerase